MPIGIGKSHRSPADTEEHGANAKDLGPEMIKVFMNLMLDSTISSQCPPGHFVPYESHDHRADREDHDEDGPGQDLVLNTLTAVEPGAS